MDECKNYRAFVYNSYRTIKYRHTALLRRKRERVINAKQKGWEKEAEEVDKVYREISDNYRLSSNSNVKQPFQ